MRPLAIPAPGLGVASGLSAGLAAGAVAVTSTFGSEDGPVLCGFRRCTGGYCPGCGGSRAVAALARGDIGASWSIHPWVLILVVQAVVVGVVTLMGSGGRARRLLLPALVVNLVLGLAIWVIRMADGSIPVPFA